MIPPPADRNFLSQMIYYGKELYLKDLLLPLLADEDKIGYTKEELDWAEANEEQIWRYFVEKELLYSTDQRLAPRFLDPAPF
ncbi:MAG: gliding motility lipoprotein GldB, partial [Eudoraea sp.]|nr:gliding motility lipoprotein GldB [Eudoraea sp.]NNJ39707.1 gliding motility lipoprotein GldB [Eudoraea sp.]